jgi:hypothetical protein
MKNSTRKKNVTLEAVLSHQRKRFRELQSFLTDTENQVTIAGENNHHNLGTGIAKNHWALRDWNKMQKNLTQLVTKLKTKFPDRVHFGHVGKGYSASHYHVWGANVENWNLPPGQVYPRGLGAGQAAYFTQQIPGVFGVVTMPVERNEIPLL